MGWGGEGRPWGKACKGQKKSRSTFWLIHKRPSCTAAHRDKTQKSHQVVLQGQLDRGHGFGIISCNGENRASILKESLWKSHPALRTAQLGKTCLAVLFSIHFPTLWFGMAQGVLEPLGTQKSASPEPFRRQKRGSGHISKGANLGPHGWK